MAEQLFSLKTLSCLHLFCCCCFSSWLVIAKAFKTVSQAVNPKYCPSLIMAHLKLDLDSPTFYLIPKRFDASRSKPAVILINPQTLTWELQYLQKGGQLEAVHCK